MLVDNQNFDIYYFHGVKASRKNSDHRLELLKLFRILTIALCLSWTGCSRTSTPEEPNPLPPSPDVVEGIQTAPGLEQTTFIAPLTDAYKRIDPIEDGWDSEAFSAAATKQLKLLAKKLSVPSRLSNDSIAKFFTQDTALNLQLKPARLSEFYRDAEFQIQRGGPESAPFQDDPVIAFQSLLSTIQSTNILQTEVKLYRVDTAENDFTSHVLFNATGQSTEGRIQINTEWLCHWTRDIETPHIKKIALLSYEESTRLAKNKSALLKDCTADLLGHNQAYREQLLRSTDHWRSRIPANLG
ncbi:MAG: hypothetical protein HOA45_09775, partial [Verrucomicrobia bacterium]|nr:hypothetical protein [Verrucomicrobiota bacterium]